MGSSLDYRGLAARIRSGDRRAFDELAVEFWRPITGFFWRRLAASDAEDLSQTLFVNVYRGLRRGAGSALRDRESWSRYLFGVARNVLRDHYRRSRSSTDARLEELFEADRRWTERLADDASTAQGPRVLESEELRSALETCIDELEAPARSLVWLHFVEDRSKRELARATDRAESSLRNDMVRWVARLRRCLEAKGLAP